MYFKKSHSRFLVVISILLSSYLFSSCSISRCSDTLYDVTAVNLVPRTWILGSNGNEPWDNSAGLTVNRLLVRIDMTKFYKSIPDPGSDCLPKFKIDNKATSIKLFSSQAFNGAIPGGQDLFSICAFTFDPGNFISREDFLASYFNESNFTSFYFVFNQNPELEANHSLRMVVDFEDGSQIESSPIEVLLKPIPSK